MVQFTIVAFYIIAQVALYSTPALGRPVDYVVHRPAASTNLTDPLPPRIGLNGTELESRSDRGLKAVLNFGSAAVDQAKKWYDQKKSALGREARRKMPPFAFQGIQPKKQATALKKPPGMPSQFEKFKIPFTQHVVDKHEKGQAVPLHQRIKWPKIPALPAEHEKKQAAPIHQPSKWPKASALLTGHRKHRRALEYKLAERDLESLYDLVTRDLHSDMLEEYSSSMNVLD